MQWCNGGETVKTEKKAYSQPKVTVYGDVEVITKGGSSGTVIDQTFPIGTPFNQLTFS
jgi:hypothetical protein